MWQLIKKSYKSLKKSEKKFILWLTIITLLISTIPILYGWLFTPQDLHYTGFTVIAGADKMVYFSQMEEAKQGNILFHNLYTPESEKARIFSPVWLALGWFSKITTLSKIATFHLFRILFGGIFLYFLYLFASQIIRQIKWRKVCFFILCLGSGLGVFAINRPWTPDNIYNTFGTDMWITEGNTFLTLYHSPLFILSQIFILLIFWWLIERLARANWLSVIGVSLAALFLGIFHPYDLVTIYSVIGIWFLASCFKEKKILWSKFVKLLVIILISSLSILYFLWLKASDPSFAVWAVQNVTLSPRFLNYAIGYGLVFIFFLVGIRFALKSKNQYWYFLGIWAMVNWFLLFSPIQFQRRLSNGLHIPMTLIAVLGLFLFVQYLIKQRFWQKFLKPYTMQATFIMVGAALLVSSTIYNVGQDLVILSLKPFPYYFKQETYQGLLWLKDNVARDKVVLSGSKLGTFIPAITGGKTYIGHGHQSSNWINKLSDVEEWFFKSNNNDDKKYQWLKEEGIDYIFWEPQEKLLGDFNLSEKEYLTLIYQNQEVVISKVNE